MEKEKKRLWWIKRWNLDARAKEPLDRLLWIVGLYRVIKWSRQTYNDLGHGSISTASDITGGVYPTVAIPGSSPGS